MALSVPEDESCLKSSAHLESIFKVDILRNSPSTPSSESDSGGVGGAAAVSVMVVFSRERCLCFI